MNGKIQLRTMTTEHKKRFASLPILEGRVKAENIIVHSESLLEITSNTYELSERITSKKLALVLYGAPGSGKDTLLEQVLAGEGKHKYHRTRNATTRPRRPNEPLDAQTWMSEEEFRIAHEQNMFIEVNEHTSDGGIKRYGTLKSEVRFAHEHGMIPVLRVDPNGARAIRTKWLAGEDPFEDSLVVNLCITPSHEHHIYQRLMRREIEKGREPLGARKAVQARMPQVIADFRFEDAHYILVNRDGEIAKAVSAFEHVVEIHSNLK